MNQEYQIDEIRRFLIDLTAMLREEAKVLEKLFPLVDEHGVLKNEVLKPLFKGRLEFLDVADKYIEYLRLGKK